jgi:hypothetical protein
MGILKTVENTQNISKACRFAKTEALEKAIC